MKSEKQMGTLLFGLLVAAAWGSPTRGADGVKRGPRDISRAAQPVAVNGADHVSIAVGLGSRDRELDSGVSLAEILENELVETNEDFGRLLGSLLPQSVKILSGNRITVHDAQFAIQNTIDVDRAGTWYRTPTSDSSEEDQPTTGVVLFSGQIGDFEITGRLFVDRDVLMLDLEWWGDDERILLVEYFPMAITTRVDIDGSVAGDGDLSTNIGLPGTCKCSHPSGACSKEQCDKNINCAASRGDCWYGAAE